MKCLTLYNEKNYHDPFCHTSVRHVYHCMLICGRISLWMSEYLRIPFFIRQSWRCDRSSLFYSPFVFLTLNLKTRYGSFYYTAGLVFLAVFLVKCLSFAPSCMQFGDAKSPARQPDTVALTRSPARGAQIDPGSSCGLCPVSSAPHWDTPGSAGPFCSTGKRRGAQGRSVRSWWAVGGLDSFAVWCRDGAELLHLQTVWVVLLLC